MTTERVTKWREENRARYNAYMSELRQNNPDINLKEDLRKARLRAEKAGRPFNEEEWLANRRQRQQRQARGRG